MAITGYIVVKRGPVWEFTATSDDADAAFYWYEDGCYAGTSNDGRWRVVPQADDLIDVDAVDSSDEDFDPLDPDNNPHSGPARKCLYWVRSSDDTSYYLIEQKKDSGSFAEVDRVGHIADVWLYSWRSDRLDDLAEYTWRITAYDALGNAGSATTAGPVAIVRVPEPPDFDAAFSAATTRVTFSEAT